MKIIIIAIAVLCIAMFLGMYPRYRKMRTDMEFSSVDDFHNRYVERRKEMQRRREIVERNTKYITKYNSTEDYREVSNHNSQNRKES